PICPQLEGLAKRGEIHQLSSARDYAFQGVEEQEGFKTRNGRAKLIRLEEFNDGTSRGTQSDRARECRRLGRELINFTRGPSLTKCTPRRITKFGNSEGTRRNPDQAYAVWEPRHRPANTDLACT
ncbi:4293_t:CDS:2, partial [Acaulospora colombiana]